MTSDPICVAFGDLVDYWSGDLADADASRVEDHVFACSECADRLADVAALGGAVAAAVRGSRVQTVISESMLNMLQRAGTRIRSFTMRPGQTVPCAVWPDDELVIGRLRGNFTGFEQVALAFAIEGMGEMGRAEDIPLTPGRDEVLDAIPAARLRQLPTCRITLTMIGTRDGREEIIGTYGLEHSATASA